MCLLYTCFLAKLPVEHRQEQHVSQNKSFCRSQTKRKEADERPKNKKGPGNSHLHLTGEVCERETYLEANTTISARANNAENESKTSLGETNERVLDTSTQKKCNTAVPLHALPSLWHRRSNPDASVSDNHLGTPGILMIFEICRSQRKRIHA